MSHDLGPDELRPRRTHLSNQVFRLDGGTEDNDLWVYSDGETLRSTWVPTDAQRAAIADGANIALTTWGAGMPPVAVTLDRTQLGKPPEDPR